MENRKTWDEFWCSFAKFFADNRSKDRSTKVGAVIVDSDENVRSVGYNGFPRLIDDEVEERHQRPAKYSWTEHAERNAIYNAARIGISLEGCKMYVTLYPCVDCARAIIQAGITDVVCQQKPDYSVIPWGEQWKIVDEMFGEAGVWVDFLCEEVG
jgi:dCMP deaminase